MSVHTKICCPICPVTGLTLNSYHIIIVTVVPPQQTEYFQSIAELATLERNTATMTLSRFVVLCLAVTVAIATAFSPSEQSSANSKWSPKISTYAPMKRVGFATPRELAFSYFGCPQSTTYIRRLSTQSPIARPRKTPAPSFNRNRCSNGVCMSSDPKADGTVYDDEPMLVPERDPLSNSMKERLIREASVGLDSEKPQTNVILYVSVVVAILVALAGQGILY